MSRANAILKDMAMKKCVKGRNLEEMEQCPYATLDCQVMCYAEQIHNRNVYDPPEDFRDDEGDQDGRP